MVQGSLEALEAQSFKWLQALACGFDPAELSRCACRHQRGARRKLNLPCRRHGEKHCAVCHGEGRVRVFDWWRRLHWREREMLVEMSRHMEWF